MGLEEQREERIRHYIESGRKERDDLFRRSLAGGPMIRRWLGWAGARVLVVGAYLGDDAPLCPTSWVYQFTSLDKNGERMSSYEINFCDDDNVLELLPHWYQQENYISKLQREIENPILMYHI